jgi:Leucine-rich repeat (LRR) protein
MLQVLSMAGNQFTGSLAPLESCTALRELDLYGNKLSGSLEPLQLSGIMLQLTGFDLRGNQLTAGGL